MKIEYDPDADAAYIYVGKGEVARTHKLDSGTLIDVTKDNKLIGIELLFIKKRNPRFVKEVLRSPNTTILS